MSEHARVEYKETMDVGAKAHRLRLVKEVVAFANAGGGEVCIGITDDGTVVGVTDSVRKALDAAKVADLLWPFTEPEHIEVRVEADEVGADRFVVRLVVDSFPSPPIVLARDGTCERSDGKQYSEFRRGDVIVRRGTKAERATRGDFMQWREATAKMAREMLLAEVAFVARLPEGTKLQAVIEDDAVDEPSAMLRRAERTWSADKAKLLTSRELASLLLISGELSPSREAQDLILHSALRRRASLWFWVARFGPTAERVLQLAKDAVAGRDRDKSDAGRAIVDLAALTLDEPRCREVLQALAGSSYKHFKDAASDGGDRSSVIRRLREAMPQPIAPPERTVEVEALCRTLQREGRHTAETRRLGQLGLLALSETQVGRPLLGSEDPHLSKAPPS